MGDRVRVVIIIGLKTLKHSMQKEHVEKKIALLLKTTFGKRGSVTSQHINLSSKNMKASHEDPNNESK